MPVRPRLLVASAGLVVLGACSGGDGPAPSDDARPTTAPRAVPVLLASHCPPRSTPPAYPADGLLPSGAVAVRLCNGPRQDTEGLWALDVPDQLLTEGVDELVDAVNSLEPMPEGEFCAGTDGLDYVLWFLYPGGDARAVSSNTGTGCPGAFVTPEREPFGTDLLGVYQDAMQEQRADRVPPGADGTARCNPLDAPTSPLRVDRSFRFATATYCTLPDGERWRSAALKPRLVALLNEDLAMSSEGRRQRPCLARFTTFVGYSEWGDRVRIRGDCGVFETRPNEAWVAGPALRRALRALQLSEPYRQCSTLDRRTCPGP